MTTTTAYAFADAFTPGSPERAFAFQVLAETTGRVITEARVAALAAEKGIDGGPIIDGMVDAGFMVADPIVNEGLNGQEVVPALRRIF